MKKKNIIGIIILIIIFVVLIITFIIKINKNAVVNVKKEDKYIMLNESLLWKKDGLSWTQLSSVPSNFTEMKFNLYYGTSVKKNVNINQAKNTWYYFDNNYNEIKYNDIRGVSLNYNLSFPNYEIELVNENDNIVSKILNKLNISKKGYYNVYKVNLDFDKDGVIETLYTMYNYVFDQIDYDFTSIFFMVKDNQITQIIEQDKWPYDFISVLDIDNDKKYEVIMSYNVKNIPTFDSCYKLYKYKNGKWAITKDCKTN